MVDSSRLVVCQWGGNKSTSYKIRNKFDAVWLIKSNVTQTQSTVGFTPLNTSADNLLSQNHVFITASPTLGNTGTSN